MLLEYLVELLIGQQTQFFENLNQRAVGDQFGFNPFGVDQLLFGYQPLFNQQTCNSIAALRG